MRDRRPLVVDGDHVEAVLEHQQPRQRPALPDRAPDTLERRDLVLPRVDHEQRDRQPCEPWHRRRVEAFGLADAAQRKPERSEIALSPDALLWLLADEGDDVIYRVTDLTNRRLLTSNGDLGDLPDLQLHDDEPNFRTVVVGRQKLRVAYVRRAVGPGDAAALVEIGETTRKRETVARSILIGTVSWMSIVILASVILVWTGVGTALAPLRQLEADAAQRTIGNMRPLDAGSAPAEVKQLTAAFNHMIERVLHVIDVQRHFLANAAHQLKTPIAGLRLQAQLALDADTIEAAHANMRAVEQRAAHSAHLIDQLLSLAVAEAGEDGLPNERCDLAVIAHEVIERMLPQAIERQVDLGYDCDGEHFVVSTNRVLIGELMTNLVDNALRYGRRGGRTTVRLRSSGKTVVVAVSDDGDGFPEARQELVFRRFWRSDSSVGDGAGLGDRQGDRQPLCRGRADRVATRVRRDAGKHHLPRRLSEERTAIVGLMVPGSVFAISGRLQPSVRTTAYARRLARASGFVSRRRDRRRRWNR